MTTTMNSLGKEILDNITDKSADKIDKVIAESPLSKPYSNIDNISRKLTTTNTIVTSTATSDGKKMTTSEDVIGADGTSSGMEAFSFLDKLFYNIDKTFQNGIKSIIDYFNTTSIFIDELADFKTKTPNIVDLYKARTTLLDEMKAGATISKISNKQAPVLLGLKLTLPEVKKILDKHSDVISNTMDELNRFDDILASIINEPKDKLYFKLDKKSIKNIADTVNAINKDLDSITDKKKLSDRKPVNQLVNNLKELDRTVKETLAIGKIYSMENLSEINSRIEEMVIKLDIIYDNIKKNDMAIEKEFRESLASYIEGLAKLVTATAFLFYVYYQLTNMLLGIIKILKITKEDHSVIDYIGASIKGQYDIIKDFIKKL